MTYYTRSSLHNQSLNYSDMFRGQMNIAKNNKALYSMFLRNTQQRKMQPHMHAHTYIKCSLKQLI